MAKRQEEEEEPVEPPRGRTNASGLWVAEAAPGETTEEQGGRFHPLYKKLASLSGEVNSMSRGELKQRLRELNLDPQLVYLMHM